MLIIGLFKQSIELEQALAELEKIISRKRILIVFMDSGENKNDLNSPHAFEVGISFGTAGAVIGASSGFVLTLGPILWGLFGTVIGFAFGLLAYSLVKNRKNRKKQADRMDEATIILQCETEQTRKIIELLQKYQALSIGQLEQPREMEKENSHS
ncbi:hypothetical protein PZE06_03810 [Robertmurraya sp. DFI.2.37]|jgi:beta-lactamase regulating signal transducer with metallopeptidase domain|uniref:hypothetical protein n=1 Tax=Robertmurraya sp. DFI.2.37 TaxID=3031819 RepID=UPI001243C3E2|nr:hypothetical protein [Robertmurraya sp. DFI.2.37]MDF1507304.1 hypothetical protein [Robertmurraya sp. DFI.2.37]